MTQRTAGSTSTSFSSRSSGGLRSQFTASAPQAFQCGVELRLMQVFNITVVFKINIY